LHLVGYLYIIHREKLSQLSLLGLVMSCSAHVRVFWWSSSNAAIIIVICHTVYADCLLAGSRWNISILISLADSQHNLHDKIPVAVYTVLDSWWWTANLSETCTVPFQNKFEKFVHLVGFYYKNISRRTIRWKTKNKRKCTELNCLKYSQNVISSNPLLNFVFSCM